VYCNRVDFSQGLECSPKDKSKTVFVYAEICVSKCLYFDKDFLDKV
jgi:hypothetical protein